MGIILKEVLGEAFPILEKFAPIISSLIGGPVGLASSIALPLLAKAFNSSPDNIRGLVDAITKDPDAQQKLADLDRDHGGWISSISKQFPMPSSAEINIKLNWGNGGGN